VPLFLVESSVAATPEAFESACERARRTAAADERVSYLRTTFLPGGSAVLHLFDAPSEDALDAAGRRAGLHVQRIVETVSETPTDERRRA
jgi:hypothetical protein